MKFYYLNAIGLILSSVTAGAAPSPTASPTTAADCTTDFCENQLADNFLLRYRINVPQGADANTCDGCTITMECNYDGEAWVSIAFSNDGLMIGSEAVIGIPGENGNVPQKYNLVGKVLSGIEPMPADQQTLEDATVQVNNGKTIMTFTKMMAEAGEIQIKTGDNNFLWAYGSSSTLGYHPNRGSYVQNLSTGISAAATTSSPNKSAWLAHGIMAFLSWGLFSPLAVEVSLLRSLLPKGSAWFQLHRGFNALGYSLTVSAFAVAVAFTKKEGYSPHFTFPHQKMGLAIFIIASVQMLAGILRPHATPGEEKKPVRSAWEWGHRILGIALLACGFYQMQSGILLYLLKYSVDTDTQNKLAIAYWVWIGLMTAIIVIGLVKRSVTKEDSVIGLVKRSVTKEDSGAGATDAGAEDHGAPSAEGTASQQVLGQPSGSA